MYIWIIAVITLCSLYFPSPKPIGKAAINAAIWQMWKLRLRMSHDRLLHGVRVGSQVPSSRVLFLTPAACLLLRWHRRADTAPPNSIAVPFHKKPLGTLCRTLSCTRTRFLLKGGPVAVVEVDPAPCLWHHAVPDSDFQVPASLCFNSTSFCRGGSYRGTGEAPSYPPLITFNLPSSFPNEASGNRSQAPLRLHFTMELEP